MAPGRSPASATTGCGGRHWWFIVIAINLTEIERVSKIAEELQQG